MADDILTADDKMGRYSTATAAIHWLSAALIIWQVYLGFEFGDYPKGSPERAQLFTLHKSVGVALLLLAIVRLAVRLKNPPPAYPATMPQWEQTVSTWTHRLFYVLLFALPLTGLMLVSKGGAMTDLVGGLKFPTIPTPDIGEVHEPLAFAMIGLFVLHVGGALKHMFVDRDATAGRMPPFRR
ncbi:cytochrome b [Sphingomonas jaspsi]|uniref:cytochrome b n=1 Tax=Sphingomonas jaspsi TaxID=392409 RepID=UPI0004AC7DCC|nr:cytochrome b [Sphingomonas jaspsi]